MSKRKKTSPARAPETAALEQDAETTPAATPAEAVVPSNPEEASAPGEEAPPPEPAAAAAEPAPEPEVPSRRTRRRGKAAKEATPEESPAPDVAVEAAEAEAEEPPPPPSGEAEAQPTAATVEEALEAIEEATEEPFDLDAETTVNLVGDLPLPGRDDLDEPTVAATGEDLAGVDGHLVQRKHLLGLLEALVFASDTPIKSNELAKLASAPHKQVRDLLLELKDQYASRGIHLDEVAGGWVFRTSAQYAPFVRDLTKQKPVRLTRAQVETLAIIAYRQPITRPEIDDVRGVDSGPVLKLLLERDLVRILGKRDEPGRPIIYGTTNAFLEFFGLKSLKDLPTLREFTELSDESRQTYEDELGEAPHEGALPATDEGGEETASDDEAAQARAELQAELDDATPTEEHERVPIGDDVIDEGAREEPAAAVGFDDESADAPPVDETEDAET